MRNVWISLVIAMVCMFVSAAIGASLHWKEGDGCMVPAPITGIVFGIMWGICGLIVGLILSPVAILPMAVFMDAMVQEGKAWNDRRQTAHESKEAKHCLLRPAAHSEDASKTLMRAAASVSETRPEHLLRASLEERP